MLENSLVIGSFLAWSHYMERILAMAIGIRKRKRFGSQCLDVPGRFNQTGRRIDFEDVKQQSWAKNRAFDSDNSKEEQWRLFAARWHQLIISSTRQQSS